LLPPPALVAEVPVLHRPSARLVAAIVQRPIAFDSHTLLGTFTVRLASMASGLMIT
jgi:hypothetical protein